MVNHSAPSPELCFFTPTLQLRSEADAQPDAPRDLVAILATRLCQPRCHEAGPRRTLGIFARSRLDRARLLLQDAAAGGWSHKDYEDAWRLLAQEWVWVSRSPAVRRMVAGWAAALSAQDPAHAASDVLACIGRELLPMLRVRAYLLSQPAQGALPTSLVQPDDGRASDAPLPTWQELALLLSHEASTDPAPLLARCAHVLARTDLPEALRPVLVAFYVQQVGRYCDAESWNAEEDIARLAAYAAALERLAADHGPSLGLLAARSRAQRLLGRARLAQHVRLATNAQVTIHPAAGPNLRPALTHLWRALILGDAETVEDLKSLGQLHRTLVVLEQKLRAPAKLAYLRALLAQLVSAQHDAELFLSSTEGLQLRAERLAAEAAGAQPLPPLRQALRQLLAQPQHVAFNAQRTRRTVWRTWALSPHDAVYKVAAAIGLVVLLHGSTLGALGRWRAHASQRRYDRVVASVRAQDDPATIATAGVFLGTASPRDLRAGQVLELLERAVAAEALRLGRVGRAADVPALLNTQKDIRRQWASKGGH